MNTKKLSYTAIASAITIVLLYLASVAPSGKLALVGISSLTAALLVVWFGIGSGFASFLVAGALAFILLPDKAVALAYIIFFGYYPMVKSLIERLDRLWLEWVLKLGLINLALLAIWLIYTHVYSQTLPYSLFIIFAVCNVVFIIYDMAYTRVIYYLSERLSSLQGK